MEPNSDIHTALRTLSPINHSNFPVDPQTLDSLLSTVLTDTRTLIASVPHPLTLPGALTIDVQYPADVSSQQADWKPVKSSQKDNPLGISVWKLSSTDGKGAWFARRSLHTGIPFQRFKTAVHPEFDDDSTSLGEKPARGIGKDVRVQKITSNMGKAEIFKLSAQFPGPSAPRDFVEACFSTEVKLGEEKDGLRQFTLISRPVVNVPECAERAGYVRGSYESVEFIREIPRKGPVRSSSFRREKEGSTLPERKRASTINGRSAPPVCEDDTVIDWIMITRSDPGGTVPKWMVERGTPGGIIKDAEKFLNAVSKPLETPEEESKQEIETPASPETQPIPGSIDSPASVDSPAGVKQDDPHPSANSGGFFSGALSSIAAGMSFLAQSAVPGTLHPATPPSSEEDTPAPDTDSEDDLESKIDEEEEEDSIASTTPSRAPSVTSTVETTTETTAQISPEERALTDFLRRKEKLDEKYRREENRRTERERKAAEKHMKNMEKEERRYRRSLEKANEKRRKEDERREREARKRMEKEDGARRKEILELKRIVEALTKENMKLRERVEELEGKAREGGKGGAVSVGE